MEYPDEKEQAVFNMALNTLERLGGILKEFKMVSIMPTITQKMRQEMRINLVKQFFIQATPLLPVDFVKEKEKSILNLSPLQIKVGEVMTGGSTKFKSLETNFDMNLDITLDKTIIELQIKLQEKGHFMPEPDAEGGWD